VQKYTTYFYLQNILKVFLQKNVKKNNISCITDSYMFWIFDSKFNIQGIEIEINLIMNHKP